MPNTPNFSGFELANLRSTFFAEARELLAVLEAGLIDLEQRPGDRGVLDDVFRAAHSLKGGSQTLGFVAVGELTHALETVLDAWRAGELAPQSAHVDALLSTLDLLRASLEAEHEGRPAPEVASTRNRLLGIVSAPAPVAAAGPSGVAEHRGAAARYRISFSPYPEAAMQGPDPLLVLRELRTLAATFEVQLDDGDVPALADLDPERIALRWQIELVPAADIGEAEIRESFSFVEDIAEIAIEAIPARGDAQVASGAVAPGQPASGPGPSASAAASSQAAALTLGIDSSSIRVAIGKVDKIVDLVGELVIAQSAVREHLRSYSPEKLIALQEAALVSERYLRELQERVMGIRMVSVGTVLARLPRMVRELGAELGKEVRLEIQGAETELDKGLAEQLGDPILHLVRNALDHGLESPEDRARAGKPTTGTLVVSAHAHGGSVFVEVSDDGRGLNRERIRAKAIERGLVAADAELTDQEVFTLVCSPGFSTAEAVTQLSGRGVGLDVVRRNVQAIGGELSVQSPPGRGARFEIRLPLTLTILDGLLIRVGSETCVLPLTEVAYSLRVWPEQLPRLAGSAEILHLREETLPVVHLDRVLNVTGGEDTPPLAVVVQSGGFRYALLVERLLGQAQIVVKSLETHFRRVAGIMGATILGDGRVALILDAQSVAVSGGVRRTRDTNVIAGAPEVLAS